eukprot:scaffold1356_cov123-Cylindrotheca_fusiformis.AAC.5
METTAQSSLLIPPVFLSLVWLSTKCKFVPLYEDEVLKNQGKGTSSFQKNLVGSVQNLQQEVEKLFNSSANATSPIVPPCNRSCWGCHNTSSHQFNPSFIALKLKYLFGAQEIMCQETPVNERLSRSSQREDLALAPYHNSLLVNSEKRQHIMNNLELLSVPSVNATYNGRRTYSIDGPRNPKMELALQRMRQGGAVSRLRKLQSEEPASIEENSMEKSSSQIRSSILNLGRRIPERKRSFARSA